LNIYYNVDKQIILKIRGGLILMNRDGSYIKTANALLISIVSIVLGATLQMYTNIVVIGIVLFTITLTYLILDANPAIGELFGRFLKSLFDAEYRIKRQADKEKLKKDLLGDDYVKDKIKEEKLKKDLEEKNSIINEKDEEIKRLKKENKSKPKPEKKSERENPEEKKETEEEQERIRYQKIIHKYYPNDFDGTILNHRMPKDKYGKPFAQVLDTLSEDALSTLSDVDYAALDSFRSNLGGVENPAYKALVEHIKTRDKYK
jgi:hypothetical protein